MKYHSTAIEWQRTIYLTNVAGRWMSHEDGTCDNPHAWETIFSKDKLPHFSTRSLVVNLYWTTCVGEINSQCYHVCPLTILFILLQI